MLVGCPGTIAARNCSGCASLGEAGRQALERRLDKLPEDPARDRLSTAQVARVQGELEQVFARKISRVELFEHPTVERLARHLTGAATREAAPDS